MKFIYRLFSSLFFSSVIAIPTFAQPKPDYSQETSPIFLAQITVDGTTNTTVTPTETGVQIDDGDRSGGNLFHSFGEFSVPTGSEAFFNNASDLVNIFSRVTGGNISNIDGILRANGTANLFLINPAGILFGENASLQLGGSFYGSTADSIIFSNGEFSATDLENPPLITVNAPIGLNFREQPGDIIHRSAVNGLGLAVTEGKRLSLIGGNVNLENGAIALAPGGIVELGGLVETGTISIAEDGSLSFPNDVAKGNISLSDSSAIAVFVLGSDRNAGDINLTAKSLEINNGARLFANTTGQGKAGNIRLNATDTIALNGSSDNAVNILVNSGSDALGNAGNIEITTGFLTANNAFLTTSGSTNSSSGNVTINASDTVSFANNSTIFVSGADGGSINIEAKRLEITSGSKFFAGIGIDSGSAEAQAGDVVINLTEDLLIDGVGSDESTNISNQNFGMGNAGNVSITARNIEFSNGASIFNSNGGGGNLGNITLVATGDISFDGIQGFVSSGISNFVAQGATGDVGEIEIQAQNLSVTNGGQIQSLVGGTANSGDVNLNVADTILADGTGEVTFSDGTTGVLSSQITSEVAISGNGDSGDINLTTQNLSLSRNGQIGASMFGVGNAGDININADVITIGEPGNTTISPSSISSEAISGVLDNPLLEANAGDITINTRSLSISDGGDISAGISGIGNGGNIKINATEFLVVDGTGFINDLEVISGINASTTPDSIGDGGNIEITTPKLSVTNFAEIRALARGEGNAGDISIIAEDSLTLAETGFIRVEVQPGATGNGGNITVNTSNLTLSDRSLIGADVLENATGDGGNITVETETLTLSDGSQISAGTFGAGNAGSLNINATESINISGTQEQSRGGLFANALIGNGKGGDIFVSTDKLTISDGATITVSNFSSLGFLEPGTGEAGSLRIVANSLTLDNEARIDAATRSGNGGNIIFEIADNLILRKDSFISARALNQANGGNINIDAEFIISFPNQNNDIIASAEQGEGGNINITAESLFGIEERSLNPQTNDLNASSQFGLDGTISINTPDTNPLRGTAELPVNLVTSLVIVSDACSVSDTEKTSGLIVQGKGGVPPKPIEPFNGETLIIEEQVTLENTSKESNQIRQQEAQFLDNTPENGLIPPHIQPVAITETGEKLYLARGIIKQDDGTVILTAYPTSGNVSRQAIDFEGCN